MKKEFEIKDGTGPKGDKFYDFRVDPSMQHVPTETVNTFVAMNASIRSNHERLEGVYAEHVNNSKGAILATAERALSRVPDGKKKKALILGAGNCLDIPLLQLTDKFDEVTLVEVDYESTERVVRQLTLDRQRKTKVIAADITGVVGEFAGRVQQAMTSSLPEFLIKGAEIVRNIDVVEKAPDLGNDYTFVSSQLVMSQLANLPHEFLYSTVHKRYGAWLSTMPGG